MSSDQQNQNDIDQILNEVEELRKELSSEAETVGTEAVAKEMASVLSEVKAPTSTPTPTPTPAPTLAQATEVAKELAALAEAALGEATKVVDTTFPLETPATEAPVAEMPVVEMPEAIASAALSTTDSLPDFNEEDSMESTLAEFKDDPSVKTLLDETFDDQARRQVEKEVPTMNNPVNNSDGTESSPSLTMSLTGSMTLKLKYEFAGQEVTVGFTDEYLKVELADGTEFKIPVGRQKTLRRVA